MTRDRARKKSVRAQMAASGEPYSVAARKLGSAGAADEAAARDEIIARVEATLAASSARFEVRKQVTAAPVTAPARDRHRHGPVKRLADIAVKAAWDHLLPGQARTAASGTARGIIEPAARQFQHHQLTQDNGVRALAMVISDARCRKIAAIVSGTTGVFTVWVDGEHVRQIQAVTPKKKRTVVTVLATTTVTAQLWDFGVPADSMDWPPLPPPRGRALPLTRRV